MDEPDAGIGTASGKGGQGSGEWRAGWGWRSAGRRGGVEGFTTSTSTRLFLTLLVGAFVAGPAALVLELGRPPVAPVVAAAPPATIQEVGPSSRAAATATQLVRAWLSAGSEDREQLAGLVMMPPPTWPLPAVRPTPPAWVDVADLQQTAAGEWRVLVQAGGGLAGRAATYLVLVQVTDRSAAAVSMPARVTAPISAPPAAPDLETIRLTDPAAQAVSGFTTSLLTGDVELSRWLSPDSSLQPGPQACETVNATQVLSTTADPVLADGTELTVLATVDCTTTQGPGRSLIVQSLQYPLLLRARDGRWEVVDYADSPLQPPSQPEPATQPNLGAATPTSSPTGR